MGASPLVQLPPLPGVQRASQLVAPAVTRAWTHTTLAGRLSELSGEGPTAVLSLALDLVHSAQRAQEPCAWITTRQSAFFPPDADARGIDLEALVVIRAPHVRGLGRAADQLARSGAFGLILVDLAGGQSPSGQLALPQALDPLPMPLQSRLLGLAQSHDIALVFLTRKPPETPSLSSLVSLRLEARRLSRPDGSYLCEARALKDKRHAPGWRHAEVYLGPAGLR